MAQDSNSMNYWNDRFRNNHTIWGLEPSEGAVKALEFLNGASNQRRILDVGCGYGRDLALFHRNGYEVTGLDFSEEATKLGRQLFPLIRFDTGSVLPLPYKDGSFDIVYGYFTLHLLNQQDRLRLLEESRRVLAEEGYIIQTVASANDSDFGNGKEIEKGSFVSKRGVIKHFYTLDDLLTEFRGSKIVKTEELRIHHTHDEPHDHFNYFIVAQKTSN